VSLCVIIIALSSSIVLSLMIPPKRNLVQEAADAGAANRPLPSASKPD
jgi:hypothetical protein